ncbi:LOW QUALITY PROTEIN: hypothetical protein PHMEG_00019617 [Phytophthora megakarya]|uniref:HAT C-terminal dimerisation domain-containing protein n=1 Tax=Phytophthora megakarya TaxID=4795 RepID=A0A225VQU9_9STRA|nr:LOW QUALITY PROTEIN: hypothetical protein PHMEG_00019617 [Phytophthora megakarya]
MASEISRVIGEVEAVAGVGKVIAVVSDKAATMKKAGGLVERKHPNVIFNGCSAHAANLLLKYAQDQTLCGCTEESCNVGYVYSSKVFTVGSRTDQVSPASQRSKSRRVASPRFDPVEKCIKNIIRNRGPLKAAFADPELMKRYADPAAAKKLDEAQAIIQDKQHWAAAKVVLKLTKPDKQYWAAAKVKLTKPVTQAVALFEYDTCSNSMILHEFERLKQAPEYTKLIPGLFNSASCDPESGRRTLEVHLPSLQFYKNHVPARSIKGYLRFTDNTLRDTVTDAVKLAERFGLPTHVNPNSFRIELLDFIGMKKSRSAENKLKDSADPPLHRWLMDENYPKLFHFAVKVLGMPTSSAASERLWSVHGFTQSKLRRHLRVTTVEKPAFIYSNTGYAKPISMPLHQTPPVASDWDGGSDSDYDDSEDEEDYDCLFDLSDVEFEYLLDAIVSVDATGEQD